MLVDLSRCLGVVVCASSVCVGCVVSTYGPPGTPPVVPLPPEAVVQESDSPVDDGPTEIEAKHILISYQGAMRAAPYIKRTKEQAELLATELQERAASGEDFGELAEEHSDDPGSAAQGGLLGRFTRQQMVPEFSDAAFSLPIGGVSQVVESPFGFHVIQRTE